MFLEDHILATLTLEFQDHTTLPLKYLCFLRIYDLAYTRNSFLVEGNFKLQYSYELILPSARIDYPPLL